MTMTPTPSAGELLRLVRDNLDGRFDRWEREQKALDQLATIIEEARAYIEREPCRCGARLEFALSRGRRSTSACARCRLLARIDGGRHE